MSNVASGKAQQVKMQEIKTVLMLREFLSFLLLQSKKQN